MGIYHYQFHTKQLLKKILLALTSLTNLSIPNSVTSIDSFAFYGNNLTNVTFPDSVTFIGVNAFLGNEVLNVTIGANVSFGDYDESEEAGIVPGDFNKVYLITANRRELILVNSIIINGLNNKGEKSRGTS